MKRLFPRIVISLLATLFVSINAFSAPSILFKHAGSSQKNTVNALPSVLKDVIANIEVKNPDLSKIIVYQFDDHYVLYLLSAKTWGVSKVRVDVDSVSGVKNIISLYRESDAEWKSMTHAASVCPDNNIQFVAISAFPEVGHVKQDVDAVYEAAKKRYHAIEVLGDVANGETYENWMSCPNLKGFYSIGPGDNYELIVGNGDVVSWNFLQASELEKAYRDTTFILNSPFVYNFPFGSQLTFGRAMSKTDFALDPGPTAHELVAGYADLVIGTSEDVSACFAKKALAGARMNNVTLNACIGGLDFYYKNFQISEPGKVMV